jgi:hypothetical protein
MDIALLAPVLSGKNGRAERRVDLDLEQCLDRASGKSESRGDTRQSLALHQRKWKTILSLNGADTI